MISILEFPTNKNFQYPIENKNYYKKNKASTKLFEDMSTIYNNYCPYCGEDISSRASKFDKEHTIEKAQDGVELKHLIECKFNLCISCKTCNLNKKNQTKSVENCFQIQNYYSSVCVNNNCINYCFIYKETLKDYINKNKVIVQPVGVKNSITNEQLKIGYNIKERLFVPLENIKYTKSDKELINGHIKRFKLNIDKPKAMNKVVRHCLNQLEKSGAQIDSTFIDRDNNYDNILDIKFLEYLVTLDFEQQYLLLADLNNSYNKQG